MILKKATLAAIALALPAGLVMADSAAAQSMKIKDACKTDIETLCADAKGKGKRPKCLRDNEAKLSPDCAKAVSMKPESWGRDSSDASSKKPDDDGADE